MRKILPLLLLLVSCAPLDPHTQYRVQTRREASGRLVGCMGWNLCRKPLSYWHEQACWVDNRRFCVSHGLEPSCGEDGIWGMQIDCLKGWRR